MFTLTIKTANEAFTDQGEESSEAAMQEVARILRHIAQKLENGQDSGKVMDVNGNSVGDFGFSTLLTGRGGSTAAKCRGD